MLSLHSHHYNSIRLLLHSHVTIKNVSCSVAVTARQQRTRTHPRTHQMTLSSHTSCETSPSSSPEICCVWIFGLFCFSLFAQPNISPPLFRRSTFDDPDPAGLKKIKRYVYTSYVIDDPRNSFQHIYTLKNNVAHMYERRAYVPCKSGIKLRRVVSHQPQTQNTEDVRVLGCADVHTPFASAVKNSTQTHRLHNWQLTLPFAIEPSHKLVLFFYLRV